MCATGDHDLALELTRPLVTEIALRGRQEVGDWVERVVAIAPADEQVTAWGLLWASQRYVQGGDPGSYARFAARVGEPDHPLARYARAYADGQADHLAACAPAAVAAAAAQDGAFVADLLELRRVTNLPQTSTSRQPRFPSRPRLSRSGTSGGRKEQTWRNEDDG